MTTRLERLREQVRLSETLEPFTHDVQLALLDIAEALDEIESRSGVGATSEQPLTDLAAINRIARSALASLDAPEGASGSYSTGGAENDEECDGSRYCKAASHIAGCFAGGAER